MPKKAKWILIFTIFVCLISMIDFIGFKADAAQQATVERVIDGDTIVIKLSTGQIEKVRLIGIDTPETVHPSKPVEYFGREASAYTKNNLLGKQIRLEYDWQKRDKYGRLLAYVFVGGKLFNNQIIRDGYAHAYLKYPFRQDYQQMFLASERFARNNHLGLWGNTSHIISPTTPADNPAGKFIGNKSSRKFHKPECRYAQKIKPKNKILFTSPDDAKKQGYIPCKICKP